MKSLKTHSFNIILGSQSPRRQQLLEQLDILFEVRVLETDEQFPVDLRSDKVAEFLAIQKGNAFLKNMGENNLVITADTIVILEDEILGKPKGRKEAIEMLRSLSGQRHAVITGVAFSTESNQHSFSEKTEVSFKNLSEDEIIFYIDNYKPFDKAGSYGIQEWIGLIAVTEIKGCFFNVMGLPVPRLYRELQGFIHSSK